jgi:hypothetical protein
MQVKYFIKRGLMFAAPLLLWILVVVVVDPFDYFDVVHVVPEQLKIDNVASLNHLMFNMLKEKHKPAENLLIGDSRVEDLPLEEIDQVSGQEYSRLSSNALKLNEAIDLFWYANRQMHVKRVVFGINFNQYNEYAFADRVQSVEAVIHNPLLYVFDRSVAQAVYYDVKASLTHRKAFSSLPPMSRDEFWHYIVDVRGKEHYGKYRYPDALVRRMREMVAYAKVHNMELTFIIVPHHADFQRRVREFGLLDEYLRFKRDMCGLGVRVVDYDYVCDLTSRMTNFRDPIHYNEEIGKMIVDEVFGGQMVWGKLMSPSWLEKCPSFLF